MPSTIHFQDGTQVNVEEDIELVQGGIEACLETPERSGILLNLLEAETGLSLYLNPARVVYAIAIDEESSSGSIPSG